MSWTENESLFDWIRFEWWQEIQRKHTLNNCSLFPLCLCQKTIFPVKEPISCSICCRQIQHSPNWIFPGDLAVSVAIGCIFREEVNVKEWTDYTAEFNGREINFMNQTQNLSELEFDGSTSVLNLSGEDQNSICLYVWNYAIGHSFSPWQRSLFQCNCWLKDWNLILQLQHWS